VLITITFGLLCVKESAKDAEFRARLDEHLAEMQLAVEEQELQKVAAVKQGETAADEIQRRCTSLLEVLLSAQFIICYINWLFVKYRHSTDFQSRTDPIASVVLLCKFIYSFELSRISALFVCKHLSVCACQSQGCK